MDKTYIIHRRYLKQALDHIEKFEESIEKWNSKHKGYLTSIKIEYDKDTDGYNIEINIKNDEQENTNPTTEVTGSHDLL